MSMCYGHSREWDPAILPCLNDRHGSAREEQHGEKQQPWLLLQVTTAYK